VLVADEVVAPLSSAPFRRLGPSLRADAKQALGETALPFKSCGLRRQLAVSFSSVFFEVPEAWLPSAMFCTPLRAACTI
jgi:hypothetical protein